MLEADVRGDGQAPVATFRTGYAVSFRYAVRRDLPILMSIDTMSFARPWGTPDFARHFDDVRTCCQVIERRERIVGYMVYRFEKRFGQRSLQVFRLAVHPDFRGHGIGRRAVEKLREKLARSTTLCGWEIVVREENLAAQQWLRACGVPADFILPAHFSDTGEDGYRFREAAPRRSSVQPPT